MTKPTYTADQVKKMLGDSMDAFSKGMIDLIRECAAHPKYKNMMGEDALKAVADKLEILKKIQ